MKWAFWKNEPDATYSSPRVTLAAQQEMDQADIFAATHLSGTPHCDPRVLHEPGACEYCDAQPEWQALRIVWRIAFSGYGAREGQLPDPATFARGSSWAEWSGNQAKPVQCCDKDDDGDGNCYTHSAPGVFRNEQFGDTRSSFYSAWTSKDKA